MYQRLHRDNAFNVWMFQKTSKDGSSWIILGLVVVATEMVLFVKGLKNTYPDSTIIEAIKMLVEEAKNA